MQEGDRPPEDPVRLLLDELLQMSTALERLITAVNLTNAASSLPDGQTVTTALAKRDVLALRQGVLRSAAEAVTQAQARYSRSEIRLARQLDVAAVREEIDDLARQRREVDTAIQGHNWTTELIEDASRYPRQRRAPRVATARKLLPGRAGARAGCSHPLSHRHAPHRHRATCAEHDHHQVLS